jgi:hypothetical protein
MQKLSEVIGEFAIEHDLDFVGRALLEDDADGAVWQWCGEQGEARSGVEMFTDKNKPSKVDVHGYMRMSGLQCCTSINLANVSADDLADALAEIAGVVRFEGVRDAE